MATPAAFLSTLTAGRQSAGYFDRSEADAATYSQTAAVEGAGPYRPPYATAAPHGHSHHHNSESEQQQQHPAATYVESCPAGVRCPFRSKHQVEASKNNSLTAAKAVLEESNAYLERKCAAQAAENERLRQELAASERSAIEAMQRVRDAAAGAEAAATAAAQNTQSAAQQQQLAALEGDLQQATEDREVLLSQVRMLQEALERMTELNEKLLQQRKASSGGTNQQQRAGSNGGITSNANQLLAQSYQDPYGAPYVAAFGSRGGSAGGTAHHHGVSGPRGFSAGTTASSAGAGGGVSGGAWAAALSGGGGRGGVDDVGPASGAVFDAFTARQQQQQGAAADDSSYLYGGHKGYPDAKAAAGGLADNTTTPYRYGPRDGARLSSGPQQQQPGGATAAEKASSIGLTSDMSGISTAELLAQQRAEKERYEAMAAVNGLSTGSAVAVPNSSANNGIAYGSNGRYVGVPPSAAGNGGASGRDERTPAVSNGNADGDDSTAAAASVPTSLPAAPLFSPGPASHGGSRPAGPASASAPTSVAGASGGRVLPIASIINSLRGPAGASAGGVRGGQTPTPAPHRTSTAADVSPAPIYPNASPIPTAHQQQQLTSPKGPAHLSGPEEDGRQLPTRPRAGSNMPSASAASRGETPLPQHHHQQLFGTATSGATTPLTFGGDRASSQEQPQQRDPSASRAAEAAEAAQRVLDGSLPPQQPQHYRVRDGGHGSRSGSAAFGHGNGAGHSFATSEGGMSIYNHHQTTATAASSPPRANSSRRPSRTPAHAEREHDTAVPEEGRENVYSRIRALGPTPDQGAPFRSGPAGAASSSSGGNGRSASTSSAHSPTRADRDGGTNNPLLGATPQRLGSHAAARAPSPSLPPLPTATATAAASARSPSAIAEQQRLDREAEVAALEANRKEREQRRAAQLKELEELEAQQQQLLEKEREAAAAQQLHQQQQLALLARSGSATSSAGGIGGGPLDIGLPAAEGSGAEGFGGDDDDDVESRRAPRRSDSALLGSATRLVRRERIVYLRIPGRELYLEMLLKDGAGINRRTAAAHPKKGLSSVWQCFFKK